MRYVGYLSIATAALLILAVTTAHAQTSPTEKPSSADGSLVGTDSRKTVIVNFAADAVVNYLKLENRLGEGATKEAAVAALEGLVDQYDGTGVTHLFWNVNYRRAAYRSDVWPSYWDVDDPAHIPAGWTRKLYELHRLGIDDVFAVVVPHSRRRGIAPWASIRMNDHHYGKDPYAVSPLFFENPELRTNGGTGLFNYAKAEVRDHYLRLIREVLERYDVDGLELDWMRTPYNFETAEIEAGRGILTAFMRDVHRLTEAASRRRGHPVRIAVRVPPTPDFASEMGFDVAAWAREDLFELLIPSDWTAAYTDIPIETWRERIGAGRLIMPSTDRAYAGAPKRLSMSLNLEGMRGFTASMYDRGADGLYLFNHFMSADMPVKTRTPAGEVKTDVVMADLFRAAADPQGSTRERRVHPLTFHDRPPAKSSYRSPLPAELSAGVPVDVSLHTGPKPAAKASYVIRVGLDESADLSAAKLAVHLNGEACRALDDLPRPAKPERRPDLPRLNVGEVAPRVLQFEAPPAAVVRGYNQIQLANAGDKPQSVIWLEVSIEP
jgi:hypothetical protein